MKKIQLQRQCPDCVQGKILVSIPCIACRGKGHLLNEQRMPIACTNPQCIWGAMQIREICPRCKGKGWI
jgi:DnaJ-class molecular chaperone